MKSIAERCYELAAKSKAKKRKVGCVIVVNSEIAGEGFNYHPHDRECEDEHGNTKAEVIHAEVAAANQVFERYGGSTIDVRSMQVYVTHPPCDNCKQVLQTLRDDLQAVEFNLIVVNEGMKFDSGKIDYSLIPNSAIEGLAKVLHYGARKYKPNNWRQVDASRYVSAFQRHWYAYLDGELIDPETNLPHLCHAMTNLAFLLELGYMPPKQQTIEDICKNYLLAK